MPGFVGLPEILLLGIVALLVFGPKKLPEIGRSLGKGMREFKDGVTGDNKPAETDPALLAMTAVDNEDVSVAATPVANKTTTPVS